MKTITNNLRFSLLGIFASLIVLSGCQKDAHRDIKVQDTPMAAEKGTTENSSVSGKGDSRSGPCNSNAYTVILESRTYENGNWVWIWSVQNSNPGNGSNGTVQNLSHWGMQFGACMAISSVVGAAYSGDGSNWTSFSPSYQVDPSQGCMTTPVLKFNYGTTGSVKSYYKLIINTEMPTGTSTAYYKSGSNTGCCTFSFTGIGCDDGDGIR